MKKTFGALLFTVCVLCSPCSFSVTVLETTFWKCTVSDVQNRDWEGHGDYQAAAINRALEGCKRESIQPASCRASKEACEMIVNGRSTRPMWRCVALDEAAIPWFSHIYTKGLDAALAAKDYCRANSALPDTCYVYTFTCRNLNSWEP